MTNNGYRSEVEEVIDRIAATLESCEAMAMYEMSNNMDYGQLKRASQYRGKASAYRHAREILIEEFKKGGE